MATLGFAKKAYNHYREEITYPRPKGSINKKYEFHFKEHGAWYYGNSSNNIDRFSGQDVIVFNAHQDYRIVEAFTGKIVKKGFWKEHFKKKVVNKYLICMEGAIEPKLTGPYISEEFRTADARKFHQESEDDVTFWLNIKDGEPVVGTYSNGFLEQ